jgi:N-acetylneuraminate synthase/sialic acid synthase
MREFTIGTKTISDDSRAYVIAEIGHNHQGSLDNAVKLIEAAAEAGADAAKFQKRSNKLLFTPSTYNEIYNSENSFGLTYGQHREALELNVEQYQKCISVAKALGIDFFATAFDFESADFLRELDMPVYKVASGDLQNLPLINYISGFKKPMIISTGGSTFEMIETAVQTIRNYHNNFAILQCTSGYPAKWEELNLAVISSLRDRYPTNVIGYSGHENGIAMPLVAYTLGARVIEKHFTLNRAMKGTDHSFSIEPQGMEKLVRDLSRASLAIGDGVKKKYDSEIIPIKKMSKMIVASRDLEINDVISMDDIEFRSPGIGLPPSRLSEVVGRALAHRVEKYSQISLEDLI